MSMKANILRDAMGNITVQMQGDLDYEHSMPLRDKLTRISNTNPQSKITVDLGGVNFVGSSGICHFVETLQIINKDKHELNKMKLSNVSIEFKKLFRLYSLKEAEIIWEQLDLDNDETNDLGTRFGNRGRTFSN